MPRGPPGVGRSLHRRWSETAANFDGMEQCSRCRAWGGVFRGYPEYVEEPIVADNQSAVRIDHEKSLGHVVQGGGEQHVLGAQGEITLGKRRVLELHFRNGLSGSFICDRQVGQRFLECRDVGPDADCSAARSVAFSDQHPSAVWQKTFK